MRRASMSWLWKGDHDSPAAFEKALSKLSAQISAANLALDSSRSRARRIKALWTLYTTLTYLLYVLIITLVLGPHNWTTPHYAGLVGAPVVIYSVRSLVTLFFDWRTSRQQTYLNGLQKQRDAKIADLKKATKYDSTQELLQKYGGGPPKQAASKQPQQGTKRKINPQPGQSPQLRTGIAPPPTANIPGRRPVTPDRPDIVSQAPRSPQSPQSAGVLGSPIQISPEQPGFAPNAFPVAPLPSQSYESAPHWYDRILDVLLGEDETAAKNRLALICTNCRLVNGQAPPGVKTLEEVGKWRCSSCGAWNGAESEGAKVVKEMAQRSKPNGEDLDKVRGGDETARESTQNQEQDLSNLEDRDHDQLTTTGRAGTPDASVTKRVTRSSGKQDVVDGLE